MANPTKPWRCKKYLNAARDQRCVYCGVADGTVVACHVRLPGFCGVSQKPPDFMTIDACYACHERLDGRRQPSWQKDYERILYGLCRTLERRFGRGVVAVNENWQG